jgi:Flp pilus assembly protein TadG
MTMIRRLIHADGGIAAIEFAMLAPLMVLFLGGIIEFGRLFQVQAACNRLATQIAMAWADCSDNPVGTCSTEMNNLVSSNALQNIAPQLTYANLSLSMFEVSVSGGSVTTVYHAPAGAALSAAQQTAATTVIASGQTGVVVTVTYTHSLAFFNTVMTGWLSAYLTPSYTVAQLKS